MIEVTYTLYREGSGEVLSEGIVPINTTQSYEAEKTVRAMFERPGTELIIRYSRSV